MPELPEVETVKRTLEKLITGKTITGIDIYWPRIIKQPDDIEVFKHLLVGQTIHGMGRRGKFLKFFLSDYVLVSHLRMEGRYGVYPRGHEKSKHTHVIFSFSDHTELHYQDVRKFGTMHVFPLGEEEISPPLSQLGIEPLSDEFTLKQLKDVLHKFSRKIKVVLLDQQHIVGLGNIYVDEALFLARIHPERAANSLNDEELNRLYKSIVQTLTDAVNLGGSSVKSYVNGQGEMGMFQQQLHVYGRKNLPCTSCGTQVSKTVVGARGTHFCSNCQK